ncbi:MAG: hypothetical protein HY866_03625 [Chloroflexi bacterium]|nr:hypothetical protein [Chloroflexota bacterium]
MSKLPDNVVSEMWLRGSKLGLRWTVVFFVVTGVIYLLIGLLGWSGAGRALCAMCAGPVIGTLVIFVGWKSRHR